MVNNIGVLDFVIVNFAVSIVAIVLQPRYKFDTSLVVNINVICSVTNYVERNDLNFGAQFRGRGLEE